MSSLQLSRFKSTRDVIIRTDSWDAAVNFYETVIGLPITYRDDTIVGFETSSFCLYVEKGAPQHGPVFEFLTTDVSDAKARLTGAGCTVVEENAITPRCYIRDPYGLVFNVGKTPQS